MSKTTLYKNYTVLEIGLERVKFGTRKRTNFVIKLLSSTLESRLVVLEKCVIAEYSQLRRPQLTKTRSGIRLPFGSKVASAVTGAKWAAGVFTIIFTLGLTADKRHLVELGEKDSAGPTGKGNRTGTIFFRREFSLSKTQRIKSWKFVEKCFRRKYTSAESFFDKAACQRRVSMPLHRSIYERTLKNSSSLRFILNFRFVR